MIIIIIIIIIVVVVVVAVVVVVVVAAVAVAVVVVVVVVVVVAAAVSVVVVVVVVIVIIIIIIITIMILIIIAFKDAIRDFLQSPHCPANRLQPYDQVAQAQSCANHVQYIERLSHATYRVTCLVVQRDSSDIKIDRVEIAFILAIFHWLNH